MVLLLLHTMRCNASSTFQDHVLSALRYRVGLWQAVRLQGARVKAMLTFMGWSDMP